MNMKPVSRTLYFETGYVSLYGVKEEHVPMDIYDTSDMDELDVLTEIMQDLEEIFEAEGFGRL